MVWETCSTFSTNQLQAISCKQSVASNQLQSISCANSARPPANLSPTYLKSSYGQRTLNKGLFCRPTTTVLTDLYKLCCKSQWNQYFTHLFWFLFALIWNNGITTCLWNSFKIKTMHHFSTLLHIVLYDTCFKRPFYSCVLSCQAFYLEWGWRWPWCDRDQYPVSMITK